MQEMEQLEKEELIRMFHEELEERKGLKQELAKIQVSKANLVSS
jgi:hypothetical protein